MEKFIIHDGCRIEIHKFGTKGKVIILIPGWPHDYRLEAKFCSEIASRNRIIALSYPGFSLSEENPKSQSASWTASIIETIVKAEHLNNFTLVGFSAGCQVVLQYLKKHKEQKAILLSPVMQSLLIDAPIWAKILVSSPFLISVVRRSNPIKQTLVNFAYSRIPSITEGSASSSGFHSENISLNGAFDIPIAIVSSFIDPIDFKDRVLFVFGDREILQRRLTYLGVPYRIIKNSDHSYFKNKYKQVASIIQKNI